MLTRGVVVRVKSKQTKYAAEDITTIHHEPFKRNSNATCEQQKSSGQE
jgi:hypothetical protein